MAALGIIFIVVAVGVGGFALWAGSVQTGEAVTRLDLFNNVVSITPVTMFFLGAGSLLLLLLGVWLAFFATKRRYRAHREHRDLLRQQRIREKELTETRARPDRTGRATDAGAAPPVPSRRAAEAPPDERGLR